MRRALILAAALATGAGASGCTVEYVPIYESRQTADAGDGVRPGTETGVSTPDPDEARIVGYRRRIRPDWDAMGHVAGGVLEATGWALYVTARVALEVGIHAAACCHR